MLDPDNDVSKEAIRKFKERFGQVLTEVNGNE